MSERRILKNILSLSFSEFASKGITFFLTLYLARVIDVEGYGAIAYINSILAYLLMVVSMGMYIIGIRESAKDKNNIQKYFSNITSIKLIIAVISFFAIAVYISIADISSLVKVSLLIGCIQLFAHAIIADWVFLSQEQMHILALRQILINAMNLLGVVLFVHSAEDIPIYILVVSISTLINHIWLLKLGTKHFFKLKLAFDKSLVKSILKQAVPLSLSYFLITIMAQFGTAYLSSKYGYYKTGLFSSAIKLASFAVIPTAIIQGAFTPRIAKCVDIADRQNIAKKYTTNVMAVGAIVSTVMCFFPEFFIYVCFGENFAQAADLLRILSAYIMFYYISNTTITFFFYWGMEKRLLLGYAIATVTNMLATVVLIDAYYEYGAIFAMLIGDGALAAIFIILLRQAIGKVYVGVAVPLLIIAAISCAFGKFINTFWQNNIYFHISGIIIAMILFVIMALKFKMLDKEDIRKLIKK